MHVSESILLIRKQSRSIERSQYGIGILHRGKSSYIVPAGGDTPPGLIAFEDVRSCTAKNLTRVDKELFNRRNHVNPWIANDLGVVVKTVYVKAISNQMGSDCITNGS